MYHSSDTPLKETDFYPNREMYTNYLRGGWNKFNSEKCLNFILVWEEINIQFFVILIFMGLTINLTKKNPICSGLL